MRYVKTFLLIIAITVLFSCSSLAAPRCEITVDEATRTEVFGDIYFYRGKGARIKKVQLKIGKKYYKGKLEYDKESSDYYRKFYLYHFYFPTQKKGKKATIIATDTNGKKYTKKVVLRKPGEILLAVTELLESDTDIFIEALGLRKGDTVNVKIGRDIYTRKIEKDYYTKAKKFTIPVYNLKAGYQYRVYIADKYNVVRGSITSNIIYG